MTSATAGITVPALEFVRKYAQRSGSFAVQMNLQIQSQSGLVHKLWFYIGVICYRIFTWPWPMKAKQSSTMMFGDVKSLYPGNGLSDAVIDFYTR